MRVFLRGPKAPQSSACKSGNSGLWLSWQKHRLTVGLSEDGAEVSAVPSLEVLRRDRVALQS